MVRHIFIGWSAQAAKFPQIPLLALTATATHKVLQDVKCILHIPNCPTFTVRIFTCPSHIIHMLPPHPSPACRCPMPHLMICAALQRFLALASRKCSASQACKSAHDYVAAGADVQLCCLWLPGQLLQEQPGAQGGQEANRAHAGRQARRAGRARQVHWVRFSSSPTLI